MNQITNTYFVCRLQLKHMAYFGDDFKANDYENAWVLIDKSLVLKVDFVAIFKNYISNHNVLYGLTQRHK